MPKTTTQPQPKHSEQSVASEARSSVDLFSMAATAQGATTFPNKMQFMGEIRQSLAQVADEAKAHGEHAVEVENLAATSATRLYQARVKNMISGEELSSLLGDVFGYAPKQDGTPGKSPAGPGKTIRQRIVRAVQGYDFIHGGEGGRFFDTMEPDAEVTVGDQKLTVRQVIERIGKTEEKDVNGEKKQVLAEGASVWNAYKLLGDIKSSGTVRLPFAFDAKKIAGLTDSLSEAGARNKLIANPSLLRAYGALFAQLRVISTVDQSERAKVAEALGIIEEGEAEEEDNEQVAA